MKNVALVAICLTFLSGTLMAQDAKTVIADAQKALGDLKSITYSGSAKDVAFQQCGANAAAMVCQGMHDPMRPITNYVRVIDLDGALVTPHRRDEQHRARAARRRSTPGTFFQQVTPQQADVSQPWASSLEFYLTPWGFLKGAAENNATASRRTRRRQELHRADLEPRRQGAVRQELRHQRLRGRRQPRSIASRPGWATTSWATCTSSPPTPGGRTSAASMAPAKIVQTRGGWPFFEVDVTAAKANPADVATLAPPPAGRGRAARRRRRRAGGGRGGPARPPALTVTSEKLGDGALPPHHRHRQLRLADRGVQGPRHDARGRAVRGAGARLHRRNEEAVPEQADPLRDEHASALRPHRRTAGAGGRRRDHHHAEEQRGVLRARRSTRRARC